MPTSDGLLKQVQQFIEQRIAPNEAAWLAAWRAQGSDWSTHPEVEALKRQAKDEGLWNLFLPDDKLGAGLSVAEYAPIAEAMGRVPLSAEIFNCNAPDTGNMEVLYHFGSDEQKAAWLQPLLDGKIRSAFCMTEPDVASSDATNMAATAVLDGDEVVVNGKKWWSTGVGHPNCKLLIFMGLTDPKAARHQRHSMVIVPRDTAGVHVERLLSVFGDLDPPFGHGEVHFDNVRLPAHHLIAGPGKGFAIAQGRLGPGRVHHCMRLLGAGERALSLMIERGRARTAFGQPLVDLGGNHERIARARIALDQARALVMRTARALDEHGVRAVMSEIAQIKVVCPNIVQTIVDDAIQMHGAAGLCEDSILPTLYIMARSLRIADGPDAVHLRQIARHELAKYQ